MAPGDRGEVSNGELMRTLQRVEENSNRLEGKVDNQGEVITSINLRLTTIEATQKHAAQTAYAAQTQASQAMQAALSAQGSDGERRRSVAKPITGGVGIGAGVLWVIQWMIAHWK